MIGDGEAGVCFKSEVVHKCLRQHSSFDILLLFICIILS